MIHYITDDFRGLKYALHIASEALCVNKRIQNYFPSHRFQFIFNLSYT
jgi:hypothetical protein